MEIGSKIKELRLQRSLTQGELASRCELTKGYISQLENDLASPSIATLVDILNVLGVSLKSFFSKEKDEQIVFTNKDFFNSINGEGETIWLVPNSQKNEMEPIMLLLPKNASSEKRPPFEGEEFGYVLAGRIAIVIGEKNYIAKRGEAFYIPGKKEHYLKNIGSAEAKIIWVATPSNF